MNPEEIKDKLVDYDQALGQMGKLISSCDRSLEAITNDHFETKQQNLQRQELLQQQLDRTLGHIEHTHLQIQKMLEIMEKFVDMVNFRLNILEDSKPTKK
jgi:TolA-binding protein